MKITSVVVPKAKREKSSRSSSRVVFCSRPINYIVSLVSHTKTAIYTNQESNQNYSCVDISDIFFYIGYPSFELLNGLLSYHMCIPVNLQQLLSGRSPTSQLSKAGDFARRLF